jgi:peroxiredoxin
MNLTKELNEFKKEFKSNVSDDVQSKMRDGHDELAKKKVGENAIEVGEEFPEFSLINCEGTELRSQDLLSDSRFLIVSFYRGGWCPYCQRELKALNESLPEFERYNAKMVAITPEKPEKAKETREEYAPHMTILHDDHCNFAERVGLAFELPETLKKTYEEDLDIHVSDFNGDYRLPVPATYVMDSEMKVIKRFVDIDYKERLDPSEIIETLKEKALH